eukprot:TRINITY_DN9731_c0_g3_i2.p1 TRINITY_DN9731_c0_g3~~TRINITY_DN9731_c0_g3_i2.p1  ORF type:complete len:163 (+),score=37.78 TRINITY_DN9731_c0_g3_i2:64-552(+)
MSIDPSALVCRGAVLEGEVTVGAGTVIHPTARIVATKGPIIIGENNMIEEQAVVENKRDGAVMIIGDGNVIETGAKCYFGSLGKDNVISAKAIVEDQVQIGSNCFLGPAVVVKEDQTLEDHTIVSGTGNIVRVDSTYEKSSGYVELHNHLKANLAKFHPMQK